MSNPVNRTCQHVLDAVARDHVPADTDLMPQIAARIQQEGNQPMKPQRSLAWTLILVLIGLALFTTAAYALYTYFSDPGLQSVRDAGLGQELQMTAQPVLLPTQTPTILETVSVTEQSIPSSEVTVGLDWIKVYDSGFAMQFTARGVPEGARFDIPQVSFQGVQPAQYHGSSFTLAQNGDTTTGTFYLYQLIRDGVANNQVDATIDLMLHQPGGDLPFSFSVKSASVKQAQMSSQQTYSVRYDGIELRMEQVEITPNSSRFYLCAPSAEAGPDWVILQAALQFLDPSGQPVGETRTFEHFTPEPPVQDMRCANLDFATGSHQEGSVMHLSVTELGSISRDNQQVSLTGKWDFYADLPQPAGAETAKPFQLPLDSETLRGLTATLRWAFADSQRVALEVSFDGWESEYQVGTIQIKDTAGNAIGEAYAAPVSEEDQERKLIYFTPQDPSLLQAENVSLGFDLPVLVPPDWQNPVASFHFDLNLPVYPGKTFEPKDFTTANGIEMVLEEVEMSASYTTLTLCYQKPGHEGNSDWMISYQTTFESGAYQAHIDSYALVNDSDYGLSGGDVLPPGGVGRCVKIGIPLGHFNQDSPAGFTLTIPVLEKSTPEVISDAEIQAANAILKSDGIEMTFSHTTGNHGGAAGPVILRKPEGMSDQEVIQRFYAALGYYFTGPWVFHITVNP